MRFNYLKETLKRAALAAVILLPGAGVAVAQQEVDLTAAPSAVTLPDGSAVPMWGYTCANVASSSAKCTPLHPASSGWSPIVITIPTNASGGLEIKLTNNLPAPVAETSIMIVGQLGGGLGTTATTTAAVDHSNAQSTATWPIVGANPDTSAPPVQGPRVSSFSTPATNGNTATLTWANLKPGTYLLESGTHPSIQVPMGLYGILVVTAPPSGSVAGTAYTGVSYNAEVPLLFSEIDPVQNAEVATAVSTPNFSETMVWSGQPDGCGNPQSSTYNTCYPPAVNYSPRYYLINGVAFDKTNANASLFPTTPATGLTAGTGKVLVRMVNAGLRMHVPTILNAQTGSSTPQVGGFSLIAEDGNLLPGIPRVQSEVFMAAGKTYDVMVNVPSSTTALPVFDRELSLSGNASQRDAGMLAYISANGAALPGAAGIGSAIARADSYAAVVPCTTAPCLGLTVSDPSKGLIGNDTNVYGVRVLAAPTNGAVALNTDGTFTYTPNAGNTTGTDQFTYCANGTVTGTTCSSGISATVQLSKTTVESAAGISCTSPAFTSNIATHIAIKSPGLLAFCKDALGYPLNVVSGSSPLTGSGTGTVTVDQNGGFIADVSSSGLHTFTFMVKNSQGTPIGSAVTATLNFLAGSNLAVTVLDGKDKTTAITDYRWIIEEDRTFYVDPKCTSNPPDPSCTQTKLNGITPTFGTNFHTSYMPVVATGCVGDISCGAGQNDSSTPTESAVDPRNVHLDPTKHYYISVLPGDGANSFINAGGATVTGSDGTPRQFDPAKDCTSGSDNPCGHGMGGAQVAPAQASVTVWVQPNPFPPAKLSVFVFEDDFPLNGEQDAGGGIDVLATNEPGLGGFNITLFDDAGGTGDPTGQMTYDMFNMPLSNSLAGTLDPATGKDACPISKNATTGADGTIGTLGITGTIVTCPKFESDGITLSPLAGQAVVANLMPGRYGVVATPAADRIANGEEWLQTNTLDGQKAHDSFLRIGEPAFFQEFGPAGYHVSIGFANPKIINDRKSRVCTAQGDGNVQGTDCTHTVIGSVSTERMSRTPDERLYGSGSYDSFSFTQCYVSLGDTDGEDFAFTKCDSNGNWKFNNIPSGTWRVTVFDQWNDMLVDGLSTPVAVGGASGSTTNLNAIAMNQWQANIYTSTFFDKNGNGVRDSDEDGLALVPTNIRFRDGSYSNFNSTDLNGNAGFNEVFPLFNWYVIETDDTRYKSTGTHVVYDAGGPADGNNCDPTAPCGASQIGQYMANTYEAVPVPTNLRFPGARYCMSADCPTNDPGFNPGTSTSYTGTPGSTGRVDPPWVRTEGWQGFSGQNSFIEFGKTPFADNETGGIHGDVVYGSTRPFDDPTYLLQNSWEPMVPNVTVNLYQEGVSADLVTPTLTLVDSTTTSSFDAWAQGFRSDGIPWMNCPGQGQATGTDADTFFYTLYKQPMWLDYYNNTLHGSGANPSALPDNSQFKCYDGMHNWNQVQPAPYDGRYEFPSIAGRDPVSGKPVGGTNSTVAGTNCAVCVANPVDGTPMLPVGKYVVEVVVPQGYELVKEEDKNILIGDNYIAPVTQQFAGLGDIFIIPDQAEIAASYNPNNPQNPTDTLGRVNLPSNEGDTGSVEEFWPCVGTLRTVPQYISLYPESLEVSPFAGATRPLCDRKEITLTDQESALAKFFIFTPTHAAAHFTGVITDDLTSEFDPFSPQFGEKFSPPNMPIAIKDWSGTEISRIYSDQWGTFNGLTYSTWEVNPPNPTGYAPTMMVTCMNDPGTGSTPDPLFNPEYSQFCYEIPFMPGQTQYMDTPVVPTSAFAGAGYNNPDCSYPDATPAVAKVEGDSVGGQKGPWVSAAGTGHPLTITALGDQVVPNYAYSGPSATTAPYNQKTITKHYGFGNTRPSNCPASGACNAVTIGKMPMTNVTTWTDSQIIGLVPTNVPACGTLQQNAEKCGQLMITTATGQQSIDSVTVTVGGNQPTFVVPPTNPQPDSPFGAIQSAINNAAPGDLIIVEPGSYQEMLLMWKPVRLQGVGAASAVINANSQPAGRMTPWRQAVNCLFGLALNGQPYNTSTTASGGVPLPGGGGYEPLNKYDPTDAASCPADTGWKHFTGKPNNPQVDRIPLEAILGWDTSLNGNLAELLQEPSLMGAYEGAGITVLGRGVAYPAGVEVFGAGTDTAANANVAHEGEMPLGTRLLTGKGTDCTLYPSNFQCEPSRIDGLSVTNSSQGGGGIYVHGWAHNLEIANDRVYNNTGTLTGGITVGQGESPDALLSGNEGDPLGLDQAPWSCISNAQGTNGNQNVSPSGTLPNQQLPFCYNTHTNVHNNYVTRNSSIGDELFSSTPAGGGGVTFCTGSDYYAFNYNWVCGNLSTGDGGGFAHVGFSYNGDIEHNTVLFNQSTNPTIATNGGGIIIMGAAPDGSPAGTPAGTECGSLNDVDCAPGLSDGTGPNLVINANLIMGNSADSGSGGGLRLQDVNGTDVGSFPLLLSGLWNSVRVTNNIIANNVAGWDGGGISLQDALRVDIVQNTIVSNDTTASSGVLFNADGAPLASAPGDNNQQLNSAISSPQAAGIVSMQNTSLLKSSMPTFTTCPIGHGLADGSCRNFSVPLLLNNLIWQNRAFDIGVGPLGQNTLNQQNVVNLFNAFTHTAPVSQPQTGATVNNGNGKIINGGTGACTPNVSYWDLGVRGDLGPRDHSSGLTLAPTYSVITDTTGYDSSNTSADPTLAQQYCNGSRIPPEFGGTGYQVPPGISDATVPNPYFNLTPAATVDEGNNWINLSWGPLTLSNPKSNTAAGDTLLANYNLASGSPAINFIGSLVVAAQNLGYILEAGQAIVPNTDFYGNPRPATALTGTDVGAVEFQGTSAALPNVTPTVLNFGNVAVAHASTAQTLTLSNPPLSGSITGITLTFSAGSGYSRPAAAAGGTCGATLTAGILAPNTCTINVVFTPTSPGEHDGTLTIAGSKTIIGSPIQLTGAGAAAPAVTGITPATGVRGTSVAVTISGTNFNLYGTTVTAGTGITVSNVVVQSSTTITATFALTSSATTGNHTVTVTTAGVSVNSPTSFNVTVPPPPTFTTISPTSHARGGAAFTVTITGTNFTSGATVTISGTRVTISNIHVVSSTQITASFAIANNAATGARTVTVSESAGSATKSFTVN